MILGLALGIGLALLFLWAVLSDDPAGPRPDATEQTAAVPLTPPPTGHAANPESAAPVAGSAPQGATLRGRVIDAVTRAPVQQFEIQLSEVKEGRMREPPATRRFRSAAGRFEWAGAPVGVHDLRVVARGYQRFELEQLRLERGEMTRDFEFPVAKGRSLRGRIFDEFSGAGIASAWLRFREAQATDRHVDFFSATETSGEDGSFVLDGVPLTRVTLTAGANDYAARDIDVVAGGDQADLGIGLSAGGTISGHLADADGAPIAGSARLMDLERSYGHVQETGADGRFSFVNLPVARYELSGESRAGVASRNILLARNERSEGNVLTMERGRVVSGFVRGLQAEQLTEVYVVLAPEGKPACQSSRLDPRGAYAIHGVPPGRAVLTALVGDRHELQKTIEVPADADLTVDIAVPPGFRISGKVTQNGQPAPGTHIWIRSTVDSAEHNYRTTTSAQGEYDIGGLPPGDYVVRAEGDVQRRVRIKGDLVFDIDIPGTQLGGRVVEEGSDAPVTSAGVHLVNATGSEVRIRTYKETDHFGQFSLTGLEVGDVVLLTVYKPGYEMFRERLAYDSPETGMTIKLRHGGEVEIRVRDARSGQPLRWVFVSERIGEVSGISFEVNLDKNGVSSIPGALAGSTLTFQVSGYVRVVERNWRAQALDLQLEPRP